MCELVVSLGVTEAASKPTTILRAYRVEMEPTVAQRRALGRYSGAARWIYNWTLNEWHRQQEDRKRRLRRLRRRIVKLVASRPREVSVLALSRLWFKRASRLVRGPSWMSIHKDITQIKKVAETAWLKEISAYVVREAAKDVGDAYTNFFRRLKEGARGKAAGEPRFRSRHERSGRGFRIAQPQAVEATERTVKVAGVGWIRLKEQAYIPPGANFRGMSCREVAGRWYVAVQVEEPAKPQKPLKPIKVGVEVGVRALAVTSEGKTFKAIRDLENLEVAERRLALWQRRMSRRYVKNKKIRDQSASWREAVEHVQKIYARTAAIRRDTLHQTSHRIVRSCAAGTLVVRDSKVQQMIGKKGKKTQTEKRARNAIAPMVSKVGLYELRRQLTYKQQWAGGTVQVVPNDVPTARRCSVCGVVRETDSGYPDFKCQSPTCARRTDREANSARNLRDYDPQDFAGGNSGGNGGGARRRKTAKAAQPPEEPGSSGGGGNLDTSSPDGDETSALGSGNRAF